MSKYHLSLSDWLSLIKKKILIILCCSSKRSLKYLNPTEKIYYYGYKKLSKEVSIEYIINSLNKMKAGLGALIENDQNLMEKT